MMQKDSHFIRDVEAGGSNPLAPTTQPTEIIENLNNAAILNNGANTHDESRTKHDSTGNAVQKPCSPQIISQYGHTLPNGLEITFTVGRLGGKK